MKNPAAGYLAALGVLALAIAPRAVAQTITINKSATEQTLWGIGGFFGSGDATDLRTLPSASQTAICDLLFNNSGNDAGFTAGRMIINDKVSPAAGQWDWSQDADQRWFVNQALSRDFDPRGLLATPWTPPAYMKNIDSDKGSVNGVDTFLEPGSYAAFEQFLYQWKTTMASTYGITVAGISIQNEPDMDPSTYEGCTYSASQMNTVASDVCTYFVNQGDSTPIGAPECCTVKDSLKWLGGMSPSTIAQLGYFPTHNYGGPGDLSSVGNPTLCTEDCDQGATDDTIGDALTFAGDIHTNLSTGSVGYLFWRMVNSDTSVPNQGLINLDTTSETYTVSLRFYAFAQFSRAIRYGDELISNTSSLSSLQVTSCKDPSTGKAKLVVVNTASSWSGNVTVSGFGAKAALDAWRTGTQDEMTPQAQITCNSSGSFTYNFPDQSITTFLEQ